MPGWVLSTTSPRVTSANVVDNSAPFNSAAKIERGQRHHALDASSVGAYAVALCFRDAWDSLASGVARPFGTTGICRGGISLVLEFPLLVTTG
jgi:hypothetical protein